MEFDIRNFIEERNILKDALLKIISKTEAVTTENLQDFCITLTDYLTSSVFRLGLREDFSFVTKFSNEYSKANSNEIKLKKDLSELIIWLSKRWDTEDMAISQIHSQAQTEK